MSLYNELGGRAAINAAVELFYQKVLSDPNVNYFFDGLIMERQKKMLEHFLVFAFGGPQTYTGRGMRKAHERQVAHGMNEQHFDRIVEHLGATLSELGATPAQIETAVTVTNSVRDDVLNL